VTLGYVFGSGVDHFSTLKTYSYKGNGNGSRVSLRGADFYLSFDPRLRGVKSQHRHPSELEKEAKMARFV